jgi:hypothetical protein
VKVREYEQFNNVQFSNNHVVYNENSFSEYYLKLTDIVGQVALLRSNNLPRINNINLIVACKSPIGMELYVKI